MRNVIIGRRKDNIFYLLKKSWKTRVLLVLNMICLYVLYGSGVDGCMERLAMTVALGLMALNLLYMPFRFMREKSVAKENKHTFVVVACMISVSCLVSMERLSIINIFKWVYSCIMISFVIVFLVNTFYRKNDKQYGEGRRVYAGMDYDSMEGHDFEYFCADLLRRNGFEYVEVTSGSGDYGIDVIACYNGLKYGIQCKRYSGSVGWRAVEEAMTGAVYWKCDKAVVLTNSMFTRQAIEGASKVGVLLWDGGCLEEMAG